MVRTLCTFVITVFLTSCVWLEHAKAECPSVREAITDCFEGTKGLFSDRMGTVLVYGDAVESKKCTLQISNDGHYVLNETHTVPNLGFLGQVQIKGECYFGSPGTPRHTGYLAFSEARSNVVNVDGDSSFTNSAGSTSVGYFVGKLNAETDLTSSPVRVSARLPETDAESTECFLDMRLIGAFLVVLDSGGPAGKCGGQNATFTGVYVKKM
jgi:hypothetical protein